MNSLKSIVVFVLSVVILPSLSAQFGDGWKFLKEKDDIKVWTKAIQDSNLDQVLVKTNFEATLSTLVSIGRDILAFPEWVYKNKDVSILEQSEQSIVYHSTSDLPWPMEDRDAVIKYEVRQDSTTKIVYIESKALKNHPYKKEGVVRAKEYQASWVLTPIGNGQVEVALRVIADPGGSIPDWVSNLIIEKGPIETFLGIRRLSKEEPYKSATLNFIVNQ